MTPRQAAQRLERFSRVYRSAILRGMTIGERYLVRLIVTRYFDKKSLDPRKDPPNPPPGPLARRSGRLARTVRIVPPSMKGNRVIGGVEAGGIQGVAYGRIHELGGMAGRGRRVRIEPRPYIMPAFRDSEAGMWQSSVSQAVRRELALAGRATMGRLWRGR